VRLSLFLKSRAVAAALAVLALSYPAPAQIHDELSMDVTDVSDPDAPIKVSAGKIAFKQDVFADYVKAACTAHIELTNVSWRTVLAYEVLVRATPHYQGGVNRTDRNDGFFSANATFVAGSQEVLNYDCSSKTAISNKDGPLTPHRHTEAPEATFKVLFVEFVDGATYGSSEWGDRLHEGRAATIESMKGLLQAYQRGGEKSLRSTLAAALARSDDPPYAQDALRILQEKLDSDGINALITTLEARLKAAEMHTKMM
jgi:hypothetical protein